MTKQPPLQIEPSELYSNARQLYIAYMSQDPNRNPQETALLSIQHAVDFLSEWDKYLRRIS